MRALLAWASRSPKAARSPAPRRLRRSSLTWSARIRGRVAHHWQAIYRHAFYRGGPILTSALSGIDQALWDIKGKALGVPVYELLGGPTRNRVRVYAHAGTPEQMKEKQAQGFTAFKTGPAKRRPARYIETPAAVQYAAERFAELRKAMGNDVDIAIDFHGAISPATAKLLIKAIEPYQPMFVEEPCQAQNHDVMAEIARGTFLPIATGERVFTKWGFREVLEKKAATVLQPDLCHAGGITEVRLIAGMAEAYYADIAPHNPLGPISLAAGVQLSASIPEFPLPGTGEPGRRLSKEAFHGARRLSRFADRTWPRHRTGRECHGRQDRSRLEEPGIVRSRRWQRRRLVKGEHLSMTREAILSSIVEIGIVPVVRTESADGAIRAIQAIYRGGIRAAEITMTVPGAIRALEKVADEFGDRMVLGAGTVLDPETARAVHAGGGRVLRHTQR